MYQRSYTRVSDSKAIFDFLETYDFGLMITTDPLQLTHLPFIVKIIDEQWYIYLHLARANSQWEDLEGKEATFVVTGPQGYITPSAYEELEVPTWNYTAVHLKGNVEQLYSEDHHANVMDLVERYQDQNRDWAIHQMDRVEIDGMMQAVVSLRIKVNDVDAKFKLSQNRSQKDQQQVIAWLLEGDHRQQELGTFMKNHLP